MISKELSIRLKKAADKYEKPEFIKNDPIQFPHRFSSKCDIEISGLLTAIMSFGNRKQIIAKAEILHGMMCGINIPFSWKVLLLYAIFSKLLCIFIQNLLTFPPYL